VGVPCPLLGNTAVHKEENPKLATLARALLKLYVVDRGYAYSGGNSKPAALSQTNWDEDFSVPRLPSEA